jgi:hypothetical protein
MTCTACRRPLFTDEEPVGICRPCYAEAAARFGTLYRLGTLAETWWQRREALKASQD